MLNIRYTHRAHTVSAWRRYSTRYRRQTTGLRLSPWQLLCLVYPYSRETERERERENSTLAATAIDSRGRSCSQIYGRMFVFMQYRNGISRNPVFTALQRGGRHDKVHNTHDYRTSIIFSKRGIKHFRVDAVP